MTSTGTRWLATPYTCQAPNAPSAVKATPTTSIIGLRRVGNGRSWPVSLGGESR
ncbi:hypothetical protein ABGB14_47125 [Nonomuraea sp. B10E15]|uniref:hypothetical protein n=1 Tax=Nonomuraea sp. B10E15 TaxID=3153560 RepID=UPI00325E260B